MSNPTNLDCKLSIITINLNNQNGLKATIESVINQHWKNFEYIVIDGKSTDNSLQIIEQFRNQISQVICEKDSGIYNAMNKGLKVATGEFLLFLNSGDTLTDRNSLLEIPWEEIRNFDIISSDLHLVKNKQIINFRTAPEKLNYRIFYYSSLPHPSTLIRKSTLLNLNGFNENFQIISDWIFFLSAYKKGAKYYKMSGVLSTFDLSGTSSTNIKSLRKERILYSITSWNWGLYKEFILHIIRRIKP